MTSSSRGAARAAQFLPAPTWDDLDALDRWVVCDQCRQPYRVVGVGDERRIMPDHKLWCRWHRPPATSSAPGAPRSAAQALEVPEAHPSASSQPTSAQAAAGGDAL